MLFSPPKKVLLLGSLLLLGCAPTRFLAPTDQLVAREPRLRGHVLEETPPLYVHSNNRILGLRLGLQFYWAGQTLMQSQRFPWKALRRIPKLRYYTYALGKALQEKLGEPPALLNPRALEADVKLLEEAYLQEGYFQVAIQPQIKPLRRQKVEVIYRIRPGPRWSIAELSLAGEDSVMLSLASDFLAQQPLPIGEPYRLSRLDALREELHRQLLSQGYYGLPLSQLLWEIDTTTQPTAPAMPQRRLARWISALRKEGPYCAVRLLLPSGYTRYGYGEPFLVIHTPERPPDSTLTGTYYGISVQMEPRALAAVDPRIFLSRLYYPNQPFYDQRAIQASQRALQNLEIVQWAGPSLQADSLQRIHPRYEIVLRPPIDMTFGIEGFQSTQPIVGSLPLPGASVNMRLLHLSLFRRAWSLRVRTQAALSYFRRRAEEAPLPLYNFAGEIGLTLPEGTLRLAQARPQPLTSTLSQRTHTLLTAYQDIRQIDFSRRYATFSWSRQTRFLFSDKRQEEQLWTPFSLTFVDSRFSEAFQAQIEALSPQVRSLILRDYLPRLTQLTAWQVSSTRHYFQPQGYKKGDYSSLLLEVGGWLPFFLEHALTLTRPQWDSTYRDNLLLNRFRYGVFVRVLIEGRWRRQLLFPSQQLFLRGRLGIAQGFYYTLDVPFENRFFVGGPNSMRAWQFGALGPGKYTFPQNLFLIPGGTLLLEANAELRQSLFYGLQLAPFVDVGNVWFHGNSFFEDPRGYFGRSWPAIGTGLGLRWDFSVIVIRFDLAQQVYDPAAGWVFRAFPIGGTHAQYIFAVGYPF
ncbi:MAG: sorting and assembly machinery component 50 [Bacteroidia bacterium]|nr:sorting and assembly machinery component 50 [Bacteroidia bacterium]GIV23395.1 MAG: hypothetical protein KatS3mg025_1054 [Bacteroidia bacterium]